MRSSEQVLQQILAFAEADENIRAMVMNGSRVNPNVVLDAFCDYDILCFVEDLEKNVRDQSWIPTFGELVISQFNRHDEHPEEQVIFLMQFSDGVRIDLSFATPKMIPIALEDSLTVVLLDKDQRFPPLPPPSEASYVTPRPDRATYDAVVNEFWWISTYVAKALWRKQWVTAKFFLEGIVRESLNRMVDWFIVMQHGWEITAGKMGKRYGEHLQADIYAELLATYPGIAEEEIWQALFRAGRLMRRLGEAVGEDLGFVYHVDEDERVTRYLRGVKEKG